MLPARDRPWIPLTWIPALLLHACNALAWRLESGRSTNKEFVLEANCCTVYIQTDGAASAWAGPWVLFNHSVDAWLRGSSGMSASRGTDGGVELNKQENRTGFQLSLPPRHACFGLCWSRMFMFFCPVSSLLSVRNDLDWPCKMTLTTYVVRRFFFSGISA